MLPDTGERYLSTPLFEDVSVEMTEEELELSRSTPGYRFDVTASAEASSEAVADLDAAASQKVDDILRDTSQPVVLFALEWCEFCWSVRKVFSEFAIDYTSVDLDSVSYQQDDLGGKMFEVLKQRTGSVTLPQIFVGGNFEGGCTDVFDSLKSGELQTRLQKHGVNVNMSVNMDPYKLLPNWLFPR